MTGQGTKGRGMTGGLERDSQRHLSTFTSSLVHTHSAPAPGRWGGWYFLCLQRFDCTHPSGEGGGSVWGQPTLTTPDHQRKRFLREVFSKWAYCRHANSRNLSVCPVEGRVFSSLGQWPVWERAHLLHRPRQDYARGADLLHALLECQEPFSVAEAKVLCVTQEHHAWLMHGHHLCRKGALRQLASAGLEVPDAGWPIQQFLVGWWQGCP